MVLTPVLAWVLLFSIAFGAFEKSGLGAVILPFLHKQPLSYRQRHALFAVGGELLFFIAVMLLLTCVPHAMLLGITGTFYPSPFSTGIIPFSAFVMTVASVTYGLVSGNMTDFDGIFAGLSFGVKKFAVFYPVYVLAVQFYYSVKYVFMLDM